PDQPPSVENEAFDRAVLQQVRSTPFLTAEQLAESLGQRLVAVQEALTRMEALKFVEGAGRDWPKEYRLRPPGLYVALGAYGFDFWDAMAREAAQLNAQGVSVDLKAAANWLLCTWACAAPRRLIHIE